jgi:subfamily B ATP-binding cassette protein MsbA
MVALRAHPVSLTVRIHPLQAAHLHKAAYIVAPPTNNTSLPELVSLFLKYAGRVRRLIPLHLFLLAIDAVLQASIPAALGFVVHRLQVDPQGFVQQDLPWLSLATIAGAAVFYLVAASQHYIGHKIGSHTMVNVQSELYRHLQRLGMDFHQRTHVGEITSRLTNDTVKGIQQLYQQFQFIFWILCLLISSLIIMSSLNVHMFLVFLGLLCSFLVLSSFVFPVLRRLYREAQDELGRVNAKMTEDIGAITIIKAFARESELYDEVRARCSSLLHKTLKSRKVGVIFSDIINTFLRIVAPLGLLLIGSLFLGGDFTIAKLVAFFGYWKVVAAPAASMIQQLAMMFGSLASLDRIVDFFRENPSIKDGPHAQAQTIRGHIRFDDVSFHYPSHEGETVLDRICFTVPEKTRVAIVGESGAGKSTIIHLLLRFYHVDNGHITIDGHDINDIEIGSLRRQIGLVMQETILLSGTIRQNMLLSKPDADDEEIIEALCNAEAWDFIAAMPEGLDTILGERGVRLSGGQRQRIAIARVFLKNPPVVLLDEATSALDTVTEKKIQRTMNRLFSGRTSIVVAHRLSTIVDSHTIFFLRKGSIIASGSHAQLLKDCEEYRDLCQKQKCA